jgi:hypothetical protein
LLFVLTEEGEKNFDEWLSDSTDHIGWEVSEISNLPD